MTNHGLRASFRHCWYEDDLLNPTAYCCKYDKVVLNFIYQNWLCPTLGCDEGCYDMFQNYNLCMITVFC